MEEKINKISLKKGGNNMLQMPKYRAFLQ